MIFRAGSLMANMVMGIVILKKSYDFWKYFSVVLITIGIIICTIVSGSSLKKESEAKPLENGEFGILFWWSIGIFLLTAALFISARMGIYQETLYKKYGKHPNEALFFTHILPLPGFLLLYKSIYDHTVIAMQSHTYPIFHVNVPLQVIYVIGNMLTQYICISSVYVLTTECPSLTVTLVVTLRKFTSLLFSIVYFKNPFTFYHWIGMLFVFIGTVIFTGIFPKIKKSFSKSPLIAFSNNINNLNADGTTKPGVSFYKKLYFRSEKRLALTAVPLTHVKYQPLTHIE
jgi:UDP-xylose/UDP-N-acetylglucosamine transporter B4